MATTFVQIKSDNPQNNPAELADLLDAQLLALGSIGIQDLQLEKRQLFGNPLLMFTLSAEAPGPLQFRATYFSQDQGISTDIDTQYNDFFAADLTRRDFFMFDVSSDLRRSTNRDAIIVVYAASAAANSGPNSSERVLIVEATENIGAGAPGNAAIVSSTGLLDAVFIRNRSSFVWTSGDRGYAAVSNPDAGIMDAYQICCNS